MKSFCFTIDDNIRFFKELTEENFESMFEHPYLAMLRRLHEKFDLKIQLNLFYRLGDFDLSMMTDRYAAEWERAADWLKLSFHSEWENVCPYESSGYDEVFDHCRAVHREILRFASARSLAKTTTIHYCRATADGLRAMTDNGVSGLLGLFGTAEKPRTSYEIPEDDAAKIRAGQTVMIGGMAFASLDMIINDVKIESIVPDLTALLSRDALRVMIHEQYFYKDYRAYQPNFEEKLTTVFSLLCDKGYKSCFFEDWLER